MAHRFGSMLAGLAKRSSMPKAVQDAAAKSSAALGSITRVGQAGAGMVKVTFTGLSKCVGVEIHPSLMAGPPVVVSDLLAHAINHGLEQVAVAAQEQHDAAMKAMLPEALSMMEGLMANRKPVKGDPDDR